MSPKKSFADYHKLARSRKFRWLGPHVPTTGNKTTWQCPHKHTWQAPYNRIQQGHGCPHCAGKIPKTSADYHTLAQQRNITWLGPQVKNVLTKTTWQCPHKHTWKATYSHINSGKSCPYCAGKAPKTPADYHILAHQHSFKWLGPQVPTAQTRTTWQCPYNHSWQTTYNAIDQGSGCPTCAGNRRKTAQDYHQLAKRHGVKWLGPQVRNTLTKTTWQCIEGHIWQSRYNDIQQDYGCPTCSRLNPKHL